MEIIRYGSGKIACIIGFTSLLLSLLGCAAQLAETQIPSNEVSVVAEKVETIPIQNRRNGETSLSTGEYCGRQGTRLQCTEVDLEELRDLFDELQPLDR